MKKSHVLYIRNFPYDLNKEAKIESIRLGVSFREFVINAIQAAVANKKEG